jgi:hypothetical protein
VDQELKDLDKTLRNIEDARPFEDLTVVCVLGSSTLSVVVRCWIDLLIGITTGRCCRRETRHRSAHRTARVKGSLGSTWLQGK